MATIRPLPYLRSLALAVMALPMLFVATASAATTSSATVREAQTIMTKYGLPTGPIDGISGPQTARGMCVFRMLAGDTPTRAGLNTDLLSQMRYVNRTYSTLANMTAPKLANNSTYLIVNQTCQAMVYVQNGYYQKVMAVSTGRSGYATQNGHWYLGHTDQTGVTGSRHPAGWTCINEYPGTSDACARHTSGRYAKYSGVGNMYDKRLLQGSTYLYGSVDVQTYPVSHGGIRVSTADSDWMYDHVGNDGTPYIQVTGAY